MGDRRELILGTAQRLFHHYGFAKTTMADIARESKIAVGTVYLDFDSKDVILEALSQRAHGRVLEAMSTAALAKQLDDRISRMIEARTEAFFELHKDGQHACELVFCGNAAVKSANTRFCQEELALLARAIEDGTRTKAEVDRLAYVVQKSLLALTPPCLYELPKDEALRLAKDLSELVVDGLARKSKKR